MQKHVNLWCFHAAFARENISWVWVMVCQKFFIMIITGVSKGFLRTHQFSQSASVKQVYLWTTHKFASSAIPVPQVVSKGGTELSGWIQSLNLTNKIIITQINKFSRQKIPGIHYDDVIMGTIASQITSLTIVYPTVYSDADQRKHQSSASLAFVRGIHRGPVNSPHKWPVTRTMFPLDDVIML